MGIRAQLVAITRCDLGESLELNLDAAEYVSVPYRKRASPKGMTRERCSGAYSVVLTKARNPLSREDVESHIKGELSKK